MNDETRLVIQEKEHSHSSNQIDFSDVPDEYVIVKNGPSQKHIAHEDDLQEKRSLYYPDEGRFVVNALGVYETFCGITMSSREQSIHDGWDTTRGEEAPVFLRSLLCSNCLRSMQAKTTVTTEKVTGDQ